MPDTPSKPIIEIVPPARGGGYRIYFSDLQNFAGTGPTLQMAIAALNKSLTAAQETENAESAAQDDGTSQEALWRGDKFLRNRYEQYRLMLLGIGW